MAINGTDNSETLYGTSGDDTIYGRGGDDTIYAESGNDVIYGGAGMDVLIGADGNDDLHGGTGADILAGGAGVNNLWGGGGADTFRMSLNPTASSDDWIGDFMKGTDKIDVSGWGVSSFDQLQVLLQTDQSGSAYLDAFYNGYDHYLTVCGMTAGELSASDFVFADSGSSVQRGTDFRDVLFGSMDDDKLFGGLGDDTLLGGGGNDLLNGGVGNDDLRGGDGNDRLIGRAGVDMLTGGAGADTFIFNILQKNGDVITDFEAGVDKIRLDRLDADASTAGHQHFNFIGTADISAVGDLNVTHVNGDTIVTANVSGDTDYELQIVLKGNIDLQASDFIL